MESITNFADIFKKNFLEIGRMTDVSFLGVTVTMIVSLAVGLFIFFIYKKCYKGVVYSHNFNMVLVLMALITSMIIITISSNILLSLGMVGALSIVRFRTAVKDPIDLAFLFWSIAGGIASGARLYSIVVFGSLVIGLVFFILTRYRNRNKVYLLVINYMESANSSILTIVNKMDNVLKTKTITDGKIELTIELTLKDNNTAFVNQLSEIDGVSGVVLVEYNGDFAE